MMQARHGTGQGREHGTVLGPDDPDPVAVVNPGGTAPLVLVCEHAGRAIPKALGRLGLDDAALARHIAWDIGAEGVSRHLAQSLDATLVLQRYSRLVVDCNRPAPAPDSMPERSDGTPVPANLALAPDARAARWTEIHVPFHAAVARYLDAARTRGPVALLAVHSFTPALETDGRPRPWEIGLLARRDPGLAPALMDALIAERPTLVAAFNEPYRIGDRSDYTIPVHAEARGLPHILLEIRNDLIATPEGQDAVAGLLGRALRRALPVALSKAAG